MKYFKIITRIENADIDETRNKGELEYWNNTMNITDINERQQKGLLKAFKFLVDKNGDLLLDIARKAL